MGDLRDPAGILTYPELPRILDLRRPVGLILNAVLHFLTDADKPYQVAAELLSALAPGSYLEITHVTGDHVPTEAAALVSAYNRNGMGFQNRSHDEVNRFFEGLELLPPAWSTSPAGRLTTCPDRALPSPTSPATEPWAA